MEVWVCVLSVSTIDQPGLDQWQSRPPRRRGGECLKVVPVTVRMLGVGGGGLLRNLRLKITRQAKNTIYI